MLESNLVKVNATRRPCMYCSETISQPNLKRHENSCKENPANLKECPVCKKMHAKHGVTCSYSCSNTYFRTGKDHPNWDDESTYKKICFKYHKKECVVCKEKLVVAVHHMNEDHEDNRPENLVPLCPTHHLYMHSRHKKLIIEIVDEYIKNKWV